MSQDTVARLPKEISKLPEFWQELYHDLPARPGYADLLEPLGYGSAKSLSGVFGSDPTAPKAYMVGRVARFRRLDVVLWAHKKSQRGKARGRKASA
ncbi:MAG: hypothetical protein IJD16_04620 [Desulfovibrio sp.]|nr:hypothetical protein [Desulfovibrio sp.]